MEKIKGKYYIKIDANYAFALPGDYTCHFQFWTNKITYEDDNSITFNPIKTSDSNDWPITINIHISNCVIFKMKEDE